jgi:hypothetical protein
LRLSEVLMTFELEAGGVRVSCSSARWTQRLVEKGARLVDPSQAEYLRDPSPGEPARDAEPPEPLRSPERGTP